MSFTYGVAMSDIANIQNNLLGQIESDHAYFKELIASEAIVSAAYLSSLHKELESIMAQARANHSQLINTKKPSETVCKYLSDDVFTSIRRKFHTYWAAIEERLTKETQSEGKLSSTCLSDTTLSSSRGFKIKLLSIPTFAGDIRKWKTFNNSFVSLVSLGQFKLFLKYLQKLNSLSIPRWIKLISHQMPITLLGFADASEVGFGCVVPYILSIQKIMEKIFYSLVNLELLP
jgi:hypothetical protein